MKTRIGFWSCVAAVFVASFFNRKVGACGTAHWLFFRLAGGLVSEVIADVSGIELGVVIEKGVAVVFNVGAFVLLARLWGRSAPSRWYVAGLFALTALYLASYFFFFPTRDCP